MTTLILIRHGYSTSNASGCYTGQLDAPLDAIGREQAAQLADYLCQNMHIDALYASDLSRAVETLRPTAERLGLPLHTDAALRELDVGKWTGVPYEKVKELYPEDFARYQSDVTAPCTGGESAIAACRRIWEAMRRILHEQNSKTVAVCSHALACRLFACLADGFGMEQVKAYTAPPNASFAVYEFENDTLTARVTQYTKHLERITQMRQLGFV